MMHLLQRRLTLKLQLFSVAAHLLCLSATFRVSAADFYE